MDVSCPRHTLDQNVGCLGFQGSPRSLRCRWQGPHDDVRPRMKRGEEFRGDTLQPTPDQVPDHGVPDRLRHDESEPHRRSLRVRADIDDCEFRGSASSRPDRRPVVVGADDAIGFRQHPVVFAERLGGEFGTTLGATRAQDRPAGAGAHTQTESVHFCTTTVVRLECALAHDVSPGGCLEFGASAGKFGCLSGRLTGVSVQPDRPVGPEVN